MSILIKGMDMPKSCDKCIYSAWSNFYQIYVCNAVRKNEPVLFDGKQTKSTACARSARADNCPLVPVPPHGDLIDRDVAYDKIAEQEGGNYVDMDAVDMGLNETPTIIPSEEGDLV